MVGGSFRNVCVSVYKFITLATDAYGVAPLHSRGETSALNRKEIIESVKESLLNLNLGYIDLVLVHKTDPQCPIEGESQLFQNRVWGLILPLLTLAAVHLVLALSRID